MLHLFLACHTIANFVPEFPPFFVVVVVTFVLRPVMKILPAFQDLSEMYYVSSKTCSRFVTFVVRPVIDLLKLHHISGTSKFIIVNIFYNSKSYRSFTCAKIFLILDSMVENCIRVCLFVCQHSCLVENVKVCSLIVFILTFFLFSTACPLFLP